MHTIVSICKNEHTRTYVFHLLSEFYSAVSVCLLYEVLLQRYDGGSQSFGWEERAHAGQREEFWALLMSVPAPCMEKMQHV